MMRKSLLIMLFLLLAGTVHAQRPVPALESDLELLGALHQVRAMWLDPAEAEWEIRRWIGEQVDAWRGPLANGSFEWVLRERPDQEVVDRSEHLVYGTRDRLARIEDGEAWAYGVRLVVPRKRSLFRGNHSVWVESITLRVQSENGEVSEDTQQVGRWFEPNTSQTWDFEGIVPRADVIVEAAAEPDDRGESLLEIHFLESIETDDPDGPYYDGIQTLLDLSEWLNAERIDREIERAEERVVPGARSVPVTMVAELLDRALESYDSEDPEEQKKARAAIVEALKLLQEN